MTFSIDAELPVSKLYKKKKSMCIKWHANLSKEHAAAASLCDHGWMSKPFSVQNVTGHVLNISGAALWPRTMT